MLSQACYQQGHEALKDAVFVMKTLSGLVEFSDGRLQEPPVALRESIKRKMDRAIHNHSAPEPSPWRALPLQVISHEDSLSSLRSIQGNKKWAYLIHIDVPDHEDITELDINVVSSIAIFNCGASFLCLAETTNNGKLTSQYTDHAIKLLKLSANILFFFNDPFEIIYVSAVMLQGLATVLREAGLEKEWRECTRRLATLQSAAGEMECLEGPKARTAPAA